MPQIYLGDDLPADNERLNDEIKDLEIEIFTVDAKKAGQGSDNVYCNVVFKDGSLLYVPENFELDTPNFNDFEPGQTDSFSLPIPNPAEFTKTVREIDEFYIRKTGSNGWLLGSALLYANKDDNPTIPPVIGNSEINQFLDNDGANLFLRDWSTRSLCSSSAVPAEYPLLCPKYQIAGPVLGKLSDTTANVLYRVDREGKYKLKVFKSGSPLPIFDEPPVNLSPTATFHIEGLEPDTHYTFRFFHVYLGQDIPQPDGDGEFRTYPSEDSGVKFSFAFGSCCGNKRNVAQAAWTGIKNLAVDPSVDTPPDPPDNVRFFIYLGDTFYFYDDVTTSHSDTILEHGNEPKNLRTVLAANLSQRKHPRFLEMARVLPSCAVWDDHDFRINNGDSKNFDAIDHARKGFLDYWGNIPLDEAKFGLTTLVSYGNVDIYLMDGRFLRDHDGPNDKNICFGEVQLAEIFKMIRTRGERLVILASGSTWNHHNTGSKEAYGHSSFDEEREPFYSSLNALLGTQIKGLIFLSGDVHRDEIYEIKLEGVPDKVAPEFVSSPMGDSESPEKSKNITGDDELKFSRGSKGDQFRRGFATLTIDTTNPVPEGNWTIKVSYYDEKNASVTHTPYHFQEYKLDNGQFKHPPI